MTPNEEISLKLVKDGLHTIYQIMKAQNSPHTGNFHLSLEKLVRDGILIKGNCPCCDKKGYYDVKRVRATSTKAGREYLAKFEATA